MPIRKVKGGYKYGSSGKVYKSRKGAERQAAAIHASGWKENEDKKLNFLDFLHEDDEPKRQRSRQSEEQRRTQTRTRERPAVGPDLGVYGTDPSAGKQAPVPIEKTQAGRTEQIPKEARPELKRASARQTAQAMGDVEMHPDAIGKLADLVGTGMQDVISDEDAARIAGATATDDATALRTPGYTDAEPKTPSKDLALIEKMPALLNKKLAKEGMVEPDWHQVKHLPGYMMSAVRAIGRAVFAPFTDTPIENIQVIANLGSGPNDAKELDAVLNWLHKHARRDTEAELWFEDVIPDYDAKIIVYKASGYTFMAVKDFAGHYIYSWPTSDEKQLTDQHWD